MCAQRKDELLLSEHFSEGLRSVRRRLPGAPLRVINFDWHGAVKELREKGAVEGLWALLETLLVQVCGEFSASSLQCALSCAPAGLWALVDTPLVQVRGLGCASSRCGSQYSSCCEGTMSTNNSHTVSQQLGHKLRVAD